MTEPWSPEKRYGAPDELALAGLPRHDFEVVAESLSFACRFTPWLGSDRLVVAMRSDLHRDVERLPVFLRYADSAVFQAHVLAISDPTLALHPTIRIGCFLGTVSGDAVSGLIEIAQSAAACLGLDRSRIVYWAGSAAALGAALGAIRSNGCAALFNPLLDLASFGWDPIARPILAVFGGTRTVDGIARSREILASMPLRRSAGEALRAARAQGHSPRLLVVQNTRDPRFYHGQFAPFCNEFGLPPGGGTDPTGHLRSMNYNGLDGHGPAPPRIRDHVARVEIPRLLDGYVHKRANSSPSDGEGQRT